MAKSKPKQGVATGPQQKPQKPGKINTGVTSIGDWLNTSPKPGSDETYEEISADDTVALAMLLVRGPVIVNGGEWQEKDGVKGKESKQLLAVKDLFNPQMIRIKRDALFDMEYGRAPFEKIWYQWEGLRAVKLKPLDPKRTEALIDRTGTVSGIANKAASIDDLSVDSPRPVQLLRGKYWLATHDARFGDPYGRSRHENLRRVAWKQYCLSVSRLERYLKKVAGVNLCVHFPDGTSRDAAGAERPNYWLATQLLRHFNAGDNVAIPNSLMDENTKDDPEKASKVAGKSDWIVQAFDPGGIDYAMGMLEAIAKWDVKKFRGWLRPERTGLEGEHGTKAEAGVHKDSSVIDCEMIDAELAFQINQGNGDDGLVDDFAVQNWGESARGKFYWEPHPIADQKREAKETLLKTALANPDIAPTVASPVDWVSVLKDTDVPILSEEDGENPDELYNAIMKARAAKVAKPANGSNGNRNGDRVSSGNGDQ